MNVLAERPHVPLAYALQLLAPEETEAIQRDLLDDPALAEQVWAREAALVPLALALPSRRPPPGLREALAARLFEPVEADVRRARRRALYWRRAAGLFALVGLILAIALGLIAIGAVPNG